MQLIDVYESPLAPRLLYELLSERDPHQNISHRAMPHYDDHLDFVRSRPYSAWYLIEAVIEIVDGAAADTQIVGACYITRQHELGIGILKRYRGRGYAENALKMLIERHPGRHLANINPSNHASLRLFHKLGFEGPIQWTLERA